MNLKFFAIMSYFEKNENPLQMKFNTDNFDSQDIREDSELTLDEFYEMMTIGKPSVMEKSIFLCKFQAGLDSSTMSDRFNFDGLSQIIKYFGSDNHNSWDLEKCPVPLKYIRMKTGFQHSPMLDRDAVSGIQKYLDYRIQKYGHHDMNGPLYLNKRGKPITSIWISNKFFELAKNTGLQKKISKNQYKIRAHELRDLLKSTLIDSGCKEYVADHVIGHMPKDSYDKQTKLYPETLRKEYSKASKRLNIFTKFTSVVNGTDDSDELKLQLKEQVEESGKLLKKQKEQVITRYQDEFFAKNQQKQMIEQDKRMSDMQKTIDDLALDKGENNMQEIVDNLKAEIKILKKGKSEKLEFCCIGCEMVHDKEKCPACGSKQRRICEEKVTN